MLTIDKNDNREVSKIVCDAIRDMRTVMGRASTFEARIAAANAIAALVSSLESRPYFVFGDVNTEKTEEMEKNGDIREG